MYRIKTRAVRASEIAQYLNQELHGEDFLVQGPEALRTPRMLERAARSHSSGLPEISDRPLLLLSDTPPRVAGQVAGFVLSERPEADLTYVLLEFFSLLPIHSVHPSAHIDPEARIGRNVMVGPGSIIGPDVEVGDNTVILSRVVLSGRVRIGKYGVIKDGAVIGSEGYGFVQDEGGTPIHPPHLGQVLIGDRVWVGANSTIERAIIEDTRIGDDVKIDDLVHIGNGSIIGRRSMLTAGVVVAYGVVLGAGVRLGPGATVREERTVAEGVVVGQGAVVVSDLRVPGTYVGNPARPLERREE